MDTIEKNQKAIGILLGIGFGILIDTTIILLGAQVVFMLIFSPFVLLLLAPFWVGVSIGKGAARKNMFRNTSKKHIWIVILIGWPLCVFTPVAFRSIQANILESKAKNILSQQIPTHKGSYLLDKTLSPGNIFFIDPRASLKYGSHESPLGIMRFYEKELAIRSWQTDPPNFVSDPIPGAPYHFIKDGWRLAITVSEDKETDKRIVSLELRRLYEKY